MVGWVFLAVSAYGALYTANAYRPFRLGGVGIIPAFFASWLTVELAPHHLVWQAVATGVFVWLGALHTAPGWIGLAITLLSWVGLAGLVRTAQGSSREIERALVEGLGDDYHALVDDEILERQRSPWSRLRLALAFHFRQRGVERIKNISYGPAGRRNRLDVWRRNDHPEGCPTLVWIHGGGWVIGHKAQQALPMLNHFAAHGWVCVSANYRLSPKATFPDHLVDVKKVLAWVHEHIAEYGGDPDYVLITGGSAGGHLVALAALTANDPEYQPGFENADTSVQACVPFYGVYDFTNHLDSRPGFEGSGFRRFLEDRVMKVRFADAPEAFSKASPLFRVHPGAPPFLVIHGANDLLAPVEDARRFVTRLRDASDEPVVYVELRGTQHAFDVFHSTRTAHVIRGVERFGVWARRHRLDRETGGLDRTDQATA